MELSQVIRAEPNARQVGALSVHRSPNTRIISAFARIRCTIPATSVTRDRDLRAFSFLFFFSFLPHQQAARARGSGDTTGLATSSSSHVFRAVFRAARINRAAYQLRAASRRIIRSPCDPESSLSIIASGMSCAGRFACAMMGGCAVVLQSRAAAP